MSDDIELGEGESIMAEAEELIYRQITKHMLTKDGQIGSHAFGAADSDAGRPSYSRSSVVSAQEARDWFDANARSRSLEVRALTVAEVAKAERMVIDDSAAPLAEGDKRAPGHCFVDFRNATSPEIKRVRAILLRFALRRGEVPTQGQEEHALFEAS